MEHPVQGKVRAINVPVLVDNVRPRTTPLPPPELGEHSEELLRDLSHRKIGGLLTVVRQGCGAGDGY